MRGKELDILAFLCSPLKKKGDILFCTSGHVVKSRSTCWLSSQYLKTQAPFCSIVTILNLIQRLPLEDEQSLVNVRSCS